jgi:hypothetical protein
MFPVCLCLSPARLRGSPFDPFTPVSPLVVHVQQCTCGHVFGGGAGASACGFATVNDPLLTIILVIVIILLI